MSNIVYLNAITVVRLNGEVTYGYEFWDNYQTAHSLSEDVHIVDDLELLREVVSNGKDVDEASNLIEYIVDNKKGISINGNFYEYEDIKEILESALKDEDEES